MDLTYPICWARKRVELFCFLVYTMRQASDIISSHFINPLEALYLDGKNLGNFQGPFYFLVVAKYYSCLYNQKIKTKSK